MEYIYGIGNEKINKFHKQLLSLKNCIDLYPTVLMPPVGEYVYRGNMIHFDDIKSLKIIGEIGNHYKLRSYKYTAHQKIQSWTTRFSIAERFEKVYNKYSSLNELPVIIMTKVKKSDFIMNPKFQNKLDVKSTIKIKEYETLRITNKPIMCDAFINKRKYNKWRKENENI